MIGWLTQDFFNLPVVDKAKLWHRLQIHLLAAALFRFQNFQRSLALRFEIRGEVSLISDEGPLKMHELQSSLLPLVEKDAFTFTNL